MPVDFPEMFVLLGHKQIEEYDATAWRPVRRWIRAYGEERLIQLRRAYLRKLYASAGRPTTADRRRQAVRRLSRDARE